MKDAALSLRFTLDNAISRKRGSRFRDILYSGRESFFSNLNRPVSFNYESKRELEFIRVVKKEGEGGEKGFSLVSG